MFSGHFSPVADLIAVLNGTCSTRFGQRPDLALRQPRNHPQIMCQHAPGYLPVLVPVPFAQQRSAQESVFEDGDPRLGLRALVLQPGELRPPTQRHPALCGTGSNLGRSSGIAPEVVIKTAVFLHDKNEMLNFFETWRSGGRRQGPSSGAAANHQDCQDRRRERQTGAEDLFPCHRDIETRTGSL